MLEAHQGSKLREMFCLIQEEREMLYFLVLSVFVAWVGAQDPPKEVNMEALPIKIVNPVVGDPVSTRPCYPLPTPSPTITNWSGEIIDREWWEYAKTGISKKRGISKDVKRAAFESGLTCARPQGITKDMRRYYWQISCPYTVHWLGKLTYPRYGNCYVLAPCIQKIRVVNCTTEFCTNRCKTPHPHVENSVCLENNFETFEVWVFCPYYSRVCTTKPWRCIKKIKVSLPQCCECWSCWDMYVTMPDWKDPMLKG
ncbi:uncharacterized protein LOC128210661 [Mya arenaria]|uniref:uncharacterized protein LOC128210661 n=1 Tax=Mya arenaria TaxID=6604 RepID=UPI0022E4301E|nr:uncharacterized protein LOC128210661 [Mya arenaria]